MALMTAICKLRRRYFQALNNSKRVRNQFELYGKGACSKNTTGSSEKQKTVVKEAKNTPNALLLSCWDPILNMRGFRAGKQCQNGTLRSRLNHCIFYIFKFRISKRAMVLYILSPMVKAISTKTKVNEIFSSTQIQPFLVFSIRLPQRVRRQTKGYGVELFSK